MSLTEAGRIVMSHPITVNVLIAMLRPQKGLTYLVMMILPILPMASAYDSTLNDMYTLIYNLEIFLAVLFCFTRNLMFSLLFSNFIKTDSHSLEQLTCYFIPRQNNRACLAHSCEWYSCYCIFIMVINTEVEDLHAISLISRYFSYVV